MSYDPIVTRKAWTASVEYFTCRLCGRTERDAFMDDPLRPSGRVICAWCTRHWGRRLGGAAGPSTRGDKCAYSRLSAVINQLEWEVKNGRYRTRPFLAAE